MITCQYEIHIPRFMTVSEGRESVPNWSFCDVYGGKLELSVVPPLGARIPLFGSYEILAIVLSIDVLTPGQGSDIGAEVILASFKDMAMFRNQATGLGFHHHSSAADIKDVASQMFLTMFLPDTLKQELGL